MSSTSIDNFIVTRGFGSDQYLTNGYGDTPTSITSEEPGKAISNHLDRALALFATQFRKTRNMAVRVISPFTINSVYNKPLPEVILETPGEPITNHLKRAKGLFVTQFRRTREI